MQYKRMKYTPVSVNYKLKIMTPNNCKHKGKKIERIRLLVGMSQSELGDLLGVSKQAISKMERSKKIDDEKFIRVLNILGVNTEPETICPKQSLSSAKLTILLYEELIKIEKQRHSHIIN